MPELDPVYYDAVDSVIDNRSDNAEWDPDEMRSALLDVAKGENQSDAAEGRDFAQPVLSRQWGNVKDEAERLEEEYETGSGLWIDPVEQAVADFEEFFEDINDSYDMGIHKRAIQMMVDEIKDNGQLPAPMYVDQFLRSTKSGVKGADVDYIKRRYSTWLENHGGIDDSPGLPNAGSQAMSGKPVGNGQQQPQQGVPVAQGGHFGGQSQGQSGQQPQQQPRGQPQQQSRGQPQQQPRGQPQQQSQHPTDPRVEELQEQVEELTAVVGEVLGDQSADEPDNLVTIQESDGTTVEMPLEQAVQMGYIGDNDESFLDQMAKAREAGLVQGAGDDDGENMAEAIQAAISELGQKQLQAQQQMSQNFQAVVEEMKGMQEDPDDLTLGEVEEVIEDKLSKSEEERLREEMDEKFNNLQNQVERAAAASGDGINDTEFLKKDREMEYQEQALETLNQNVQQLPEAVASSVASVVPAIKELQTMEGGTGMWTPPGRGQPEYQPGQEQQTAGRQSRSGAARGEPTQQTRQPREQPEQPRSVQETGYPETQAENRETVEGQSDESAPRASDDGAPDASEVRARLGLADGGAENGVER